LLDKIEQERASGKPRREAIIDGGAIRLIPVLMTAITFTAAFIPPMFAPPTGMDRFTPIATALIGAIISSTALSLIMVPVAYSMLDDAKEYLRKVYGAGPALSRVPVAVAGGYGDNGNLSLSGDIGENGANELGRESTAKTERGNREI